MKNWLGQPINVGDVVHRGARSGNTTGYDLGVVMELNEEKGTARVAWLFKPGGEWVGEGSNRQLLRFITEQKKFVHVPDGDSYFEPSPKMGTGGLEGLIVIDPLTTTLSAPQQRYLNEYIVKARGIS